MINKKGFTLIELLGTFVILVIVFSISVITYSLIKDKSKSTYYSTLEESILVSSTNYTNSSVLLKVGEFEEINFNDIKFREIKDNISEIKDYNGKSSCIENSKIVRYKEKKGSIKTVVCLSCSDYKTDNKLCN